MISTSALFKQEIKENASCYVSLTITLQDATDSSGNPAYGTILTLDGSRVMQSTIRIDDSTSSSSAFDIGSAICNTLTMTLNNHDGYFDSYDLTNARVKINILKDLSDGTTEVIEKGVYYIEQPSTYGHTISITANDSMIKLSEVLYSSVSTTYPASLYQIVTDICTKCGVTLKTTTFDNYQYKASTRPTDTEITCLDVLSSVAQISGSYARFNNVGELEIKWYNYEQIEQGHSATSNLDGNTDDADGGSFTESTEDSYDGGLFTDDYAYTINTFSSYEMATDDMVITGIKVTVEQPEDSETTYTEDQLQYTYGESGYVLTLSGNVLANLSNMKEIATYVGLKMIGIKLRPFNISAMSNPALESGDMVWLYYDGSYYGSAINHLTYSIGGYESFDCYAETPAMNSSSSYSASTNAIRQTRKLINGEITARQNAINNLYEKIQDENTGLYFSKVATSEGAYVYFMTDRKQENGYPYYSDELGRYVFSGSTEIVWMMNASAWAVSTDGGETYPYGFTVDGNEVVNQLYAIGINVEYITANALTIKDSSGNVVFNVDSATNLANVGGFTLGNGKIYYGVTSLTDTSHVGLYLGTNGIRFRESTNKNATILSSDGLQTSYLTISPQTYNSGETFDLGRTYMQIKNNSVVYFDIRTDEAKTVHIESNYAIDIASNSSNTIYLNGNTSIQGTLSVSGATTLSGVLNAGLIYSPKTYSNTTTSDVNVRVGSDTGLFYRHSSSSRRYKHDIKNLSLESIKGLYDLQLHTFKYNPEYLNEDDERYDKDIVGLIAEELDEILPIAVDHENGQVEVWNSNILVPALLGLIQDLNNRINDLEEK